MADSTNSQVQAKVWVKPEQVQAMRSACYEIGVEYLQQRNEAMIQLMYDSGLRVGELVQVDVDHLRENNSKLYLPTTIQKDYPTDQSPDPTTIGLADDTKRLLSGYIPNRWKESSALFPSRSADRISTQGVRDVITRVAEAAEVRPFKIDGSRGEPVDLSPHALRHGVAYRMLNEEEGNTLYDVRNRLRHSRLATTERVYDHLDEV